MGKLGLSLVFSLSLTRCGCVGVGACLLTGAAGEVGIITHPLWLCEIERTTTVSRKL